MITSRRNTEVEVGFDREVLFDTFTVNLGNPVLLSNLLFDLGEGYRPFCPLVVTVDGLQVALPKYLSGGDHTIKLIGQTFAGIGLLLVGNDLAFVNDVTIGMSQSDGGSSFFASFVNVVPVGDINGVNVLFSFTMPFIAGSVMVYLNGLRQARDEDFVEVGRTQIQFMQAPMSGDIIVCDYRIL